MDKHRVNFSDILNQKRLIVMTVQRKECGRVMYINDANVLHAEFRGLISIQSTANQPFPAKLRKDTDHRDDCMCIKSTSLRQRLYIDDGIMMITTEKDFGQDFLYVCSLFDTVLTIDSDISRPLPRYRYLDTTYNERFYDIINQQTCYDRTINHDEITLRLKLIDRKRATDVIMDIMYGKKYNKALGFDILELDTPQEQQQDVEMVMLLNDCKNKLLQHGVFESDDMIQRLETALNNV